MRTISTAQGLSLSAVAKTFKYRLWVDSNGSGAYVDLTNYLGYDWLRSASWDDNIDTPVSSASFKLNRAVFDINLSLFMGNSKANNGQAVVYPGRQCYLETATIAYGNPVQAGDWTEAFRGYIDSVDPRDVEIELACRDLGGKLTDTYIETQRSYGSGGGVALQTVIQSILTDNVGGVTLNVPVAPTFLVKTYTQQKVSVMDAIQQLAQLIGWDCRYKWDSGSSTWKLTLWTPNRANTTAARTFGPDDYYEITTLKLDRADVRNAITSFYTDAATGVRSKVLVTDNGSITTFGRRYMELSESATSQITNSTDATALVNASLSDLAQPVADHGVMMDYFFAAELGDLYQFNPNFKIYDSLQKLAVVQASHEFSSDGGAHTTLLTRGKPSTGYRRWLRIEGRPGVAPNANYVDPNTPSSATATGDVTSIVVLYTPNNPDKWKQTNVYMDTNSANVPDPGQNGAGKNLPMNSAYLVAQGKQTKFVLGSLVPGQVYNARIQIVDTDGNLSPVSPLLTATSQTVAAYHENQDTAAYQLVRNADFKAFTLGLATWPDFWGTGTYAGGSSTWGSGTGNKVYYTASAAGGKYAITMFNHAASNYTDFFSNMMPVTGGEILTASATTRWIVAPTDVGTFSRINILWYDSAQTYISASFSLSLNKTTSFSQDCIVYATAPSNARFAQIGFTLICQGADDNVAQWCIDRVGLVRAKPQFYDAFDNNPKAIAAGAPRVTTIYPGGGYFQHGFSYDAGTDILTCNIPGDYLFGASLGFTMSNANEKVILWIEVSTGGFFFINVQNQGYTDGAHFIQVTISPSQITLNAGDRIRLRSQTTSNGNFDTQTGAASFYVMPVTRGDTT